ncbi:hypothetical protein [Aliivibrio fischeri]|uniref:hypothetical protein n=1 Tax=Aliivibrio fischeri TaxID=668 RepID=UPI0007C5D362|nr:hypothetical protein [Aliivibrio fischeri]
MNIFTFFKFIQIAIIVMLFASAVEIPLMVGVKFFNQIFIDEVIYAFRALGYPILILVYGKKMIAMAKDAFLKIDNIAINY